MGGNASLGSRELTVGVKEREQRIRGLIACVMPSLACAAAFMIMDRSDCPEIMISLMMDWGCPVCPPIQDVDRSPCTKRVEEEWIDRWTGNR